jgi:pyrroloquinoline-quinone synthase
MNTTSNKRLDSDQALLSSEMQSGCDWIAQLQHEVEAHPAVNHLLLARLATSPYKRGDYQVFSLQHYALVGMFTKYMELLLLRAPSSEQKLWLAKVLVDEYGEGSEGKDHTTLYADYLSNLGATPEQLETTPLDVEVWRFVGEHLRICRVEPFLVGLGALGPGHEWAIPKMFSNIIPGLERAGVPYEQRLYFDLHTEQDVEHAAWMTEALRQLAYDEGSRDLVRRGARLSLHARFRFWTGIERAIVARRQPDSTEAVRRGLTGVTDPKELEPSPGTVADLRIATDEFQNGGKWPFPLSPTGFQDLS